MAKLVQYCTRASLYDGPFDAKVGWAAAGMGYILLSDDGTITVIDGGHPEDGAALTEAIKLFHVLSLGKPAVVEQWIITHPHGDHYGALLAIAQNPSLAGQIRVKNLIYCFPEAFRDKNGGGIGYALRDMEKIRDTFGARVQTPAAGESRVAGGLTFTYLFVPSDCTGLNNPKQLSLIFTVEGTKKALFTGDAYRNTLQMAADAFPAALKCDILQLPHHGLCDTGNADFYRLADADTVLVPISIAGDRTMASDMYGDAPAVNRAACERASAVYKAFEGTKVLEL
ncbi:MAG: MBL fold metallo-hydrolase [Clostridia bacterium]|nr:MBL fold metallo-hydrolase [Clostridia bacterium]